MGLPLSALNALITKMKILEVYFSNGLVSVDHDNWKAKLSKLKPVLSLWSQRDLQVLL